MKIRKEKLGALLQALSGQGKLLVPGSEGGVKKFLPWQPTVDVDLESVNALLPPKDILFPQTEKMYHFKATPEPSVEEIIDLEKQVVFGIRPCDVHSIACMDQVFLTKTFVDSFYARKRENLTIISIGCVQAAETCFCSGMGLDPAAAPPADWVLHPTADGWNVDVQTEKGKALAGTLGDLLEAGVEKALPPAVCTLDVKLGEVPERLLQMFDSPLWDEVYRPCLGCGTCTYLCPTCYCFDIGAEIQDNGQGTQHRCWDSCMFSEYTRMAGGHNPRPSKKERVRNRYLHKLAYFNERYGMNLCAGCGRCIDKCPVGMDITRVIELAKEAELVCSR